MGVSTFVCGVWYALSRWEHQGVCVLCVCVYVCVCVCFCVCVVCAKQVGASRRVQMCQRGRCIESNAQVHLRGWAAQDKCVRGRRGGGRRHANFLSSALLSFSRRTKTFHGYNHTNTYICMCTFAHITQSRTRIRTYALTRKNHAHAYAHMQLHVHTCTRAHTHTRTHT